jgi:hypothetical protein
VNPESSPLVPYFEAPTFTRPTSIFFGGASRLALNRIAFECAARINENFLWLDVRRPGSQPDRTDPVVSGQIPPRRVLEAVPPEPPPAIEARAATGRFVVRRSDGAREELGQLADFLRIPHFVRSLFPRPGSGNRPEVLVIANGDELLQIYPDSLEQSRSFLQVFHQEKVTLVASHCGVAPEARFAFDYVFELATPDPTRWMESTVRCEQSPKSAPFSAGSPRRAFGPQEGPSVSTAAGPARKEENRD